MTLVKTKRIIIAITGATGAIYGVRLLKLLATVPEIETHLLVSDAAILTLGHEMNASKPDVEAIAHVSYDVNDLGAAIASGSFRSEGMIIAPCSMKTLAAIANGVSDNLIVRAADVVLKERRKLVLMAREAPLHLGHLRNMVAVTEMGGIIFPPVPGFYQHPESIADLVNQTLGRVLDLFDIENEKVLRWEGLSLKR